MRTENALFIAIGILAAAVTGCNRSGGAKEPTQYQSRCLHPYWYAEQGKCDEAVADFTEAIRYFPTDVSCYSGRGKCYLAKGDYDKAIADFSEAIRLDPESTEAFYNYYNRGMAYKRIGETTKAETDFKTAERVGTIKILPSIP